MKQKAQQERHELSEEHLVTTAEELEHALLSIDDEKSLLRKKELTNFQDTDKDQEESFRAKHSYMQENSDHRVH